jgi:tetratricopeptide (TPR) repeat protein
MNLFARILSHGFALAVVALLVVGLIYRGELFPDWELPDFLTFESEADSSSDAATGTVSRDESQPAAAEESAAIIPAIAPEAVEVAADTATVADEQQTEDLPDVGATPDTSDDQGDTGTTATALGDVAVAETGAPLAAAPDPAPAAAGNPYALLAAAREAYWLRDYAAAEQNYQALINLEPGNPDGHGELGNMYFSQGKWELASAAYFEAGKRLADEGLVGQARQLVDVIRGLQGTQADALEQYLASAGAAAN